jgi:hypothetical protein
MIGSNLEIPVGLRRCSGYGTGYAGEDCCEIYAVVAEQTVAILQGFENPTLLHPATPRAQPLPKGRWYILS